MAKAKDKVKKSEQELRALAKELLEKEPGKYSYMGALLKVVALDRGTIKAFADKKHRDRTTISKQFCRSLWYESDLEENSGLLEFDFVSEYRKINQQQASSHERQKNFLLVEVDGELVQKIELCDNYSKLAATVVREFV